jgi:gamma-glutamyl-gamma-aminobutyrate hydrolase PuuD
MTLVSPPLLLPSIVANDAVAKPLKFLYSALDESGGYPFADMFDIVIDITTPDDIKTNNSCLIIWGGGDISPSLYGQHPCSRTTALAQLSIRDAIEVRLASKAIKMGIPIIGICRGAQIMCALAGGKLIQDVKGHGQTHRIKTDDGKVLTTTSLHHQMMFPWEVKNYNLIAWTDGLRSPFYIEGASLCSKQEDDVLVTFPPQIELEHYEPEIVYFSDVKALCIQGHPEFIANEEHEFVKYCKELIVQYLIKPFLK